MKKLFAALKFTAVLICILFIGTGVNAEAAQEKITGVMQTGDTSDSVDISWIPVGSAISYRIEYCENTGFSGTTYGAQSAKAGKRTARISGLSAGKSYYIRVSALDEAGNPGSVSNIFEAVTAPKGKAGNLVQSNADEAFLSCSWDKAYGANAYRIYWIAYSYATEAWDSWNRQEVGDISAYSLPAFKDSGYSIRVYAARKSASGYAAYADEYADVFLYPVPAKPAKVKMLASGVHRFWPEYDVVRFGWKGSKGAKGYQYVIYGHDGKKLFSETTEDYINVSVKNKKLTNDQFMKIKVRGYISVGGNKKYGEWSDDCYFAKCPRNVKFSKRSGGGFQMTWDKTKGTKNYTIYASVKQKSGYRKLGTTSKNSYLIQKVNGRKLVSGKVYFFKIIANKKVGKKTYSSDDSWYFSRVY